uniref:Uncharacterized protein n=1 Tax=Salarias fasciatus TaxID=181472 RepID=A0A672F542_SALFA
RNTSNSFMLLIVTGEKARAQCKCFLEKRIRSAGGTNPREGSDGDDKTDPKKHNYPCTSNAFGKCIMSLCFHCTAISPGTILC